MSDSIDKTVKISANKKKKIEQVDELKQKLDKAKAFFLTDYRGLTHQQLETLRKTLKKIEAEFLVVKNTLLKHALSEKSKGEMEQFDEALNNPTGAIFAYSDEFAAVKEIAKYIKEYQLPTIKVGFFEKKITDEEGFKKIASLPSREVLLATLAVRLKSPVYGLHNALNWNLSRFITVMDNIKSQKGN